GRAGGGEHGRRGLAGRRPDRRAARAQLAVVGADHPPRPPRSGRDQGPGHRPGRALTTRRGGVEPPRVRQQLRARGASYGAAVTRWLTTREDPPTCMVTP